MLKRGALGEDENVSQLKTLPSGLGRGRIVVKRSFRTNEKISVLS
jgi:hypothetical protein